MTAELDQLTPNYITVNPDGTIGADFTGTINAEGISLSAAPGSPQPANMVRFVRASDAATLGYLAVQDTAPGSDLYLTAEDTDHAGEFAQLLLKSGAGAGGNVILVALPTQNARTLLDDQGLSSWLQLLSAQQLQLAFGSGSFIYAGGTIQSNTLTIAHGLGRSPQLVLALPVGAYGAQSPTIFNFGNDATNVKFQQNVPNAPAAGAFGGLWWAAIG